MNNLIKSNDKYYQFVRQIRKTMFNELKTVQEYRDYIMCDHVLQVNEFYIFCRTVTDVEIEITNDIVEVSED